MHTITIAVITCGRPDSLAHTLDSLKQLVLPPQVEARLLVIDNDPQKTAMGVVDTVKSAFSFPVEYAVEEKRGIPHARNRALTMASGSDYIAFIDDDDTAGPRWLAELYHAALQYKADVVKGLITHLFDEDKAYLSVLDIFSNLPARTGDALDSAWSNNVLFSTRIYRNTGLRFDLAFIRTGGSDSHFFRCAKKQGAAIVMCREAIVYTKVPAKRTTWKWLAMRHMRVGATMTMSDRKQEGFARCLQRVCVSLADSGRYFLRLIPGAWKDNRRLVHPVMVVCFMFGRIAGLFNVSPREYL